MHKNDTNAIRKRPETFSLLQCGAICDMMMGTKEGISMENNHPNTTMENKEMPMKWHKFLIYFSLWAAGLINLSNAGTYFSYASVYGVYAVCGAILAALAVFSIVVRFALARFKAKGPKMLVAMNILTASTGIVFPLLVSVQTGYPVIEMLDATTISQIAVGLAMAAFHNAYYGTRAHMFVN